MEIEERANNYGRNVKSNQIGKIFLNNLPKMKSLDLRSRSQKQLKIH